jgi:hypothetical protein
LLVWYSACNPVFWEKNLRCQKYTWYATFHKWSLEGLWQMSVLAIKNCNSYTSERENRDSLFWGPNMYLIVC